MHRSAPALFFCFDRVVIFIRTSLSAEITAHVLGVWKNSLPRGGKEREAAVPMHSVSEELSVGAEAVGLVVSSGSLVEVGEGECPQPNPAVCAGIGGTGCSAWCPEDADVVW